MADKYIKVTRTELLKLIATADTCYAMVGSGDEDFEAEAKAAQKAIKAIEKRNGISVQRDH